MVDKRTGRTAFRDFRHNEATMWALFEEFVTGFYEREQSVFQVNRGSRRAEWADKGWTTDEDRARIPVMEADVILKLPEHRIILGHKVLHGRAVARARFRHRQAALQQPLPASRVPAEPPCHPAGRSQARRHPAVPGRWAPRPLRADIRLEGFRVQARTIDLNRDWTDIHAEMLETIEIVPQ